MPKMHVEESVIIEADKQKVITILTDFNQWSVWSPWLIMEPNVKVTVSNNGKSYAWDGKRVGSGQMSIILQNDERIVMDLLFLKPWKSKASVAFQLVEKEGKTTVTWFMDSSIPIFMFWMKKIMEAMISMDYQRGLLMLKDYTETGKVPSTMSFDGIKTFDKALYLGIRTTCATHEVGAKMKNDFSRLTEYMQIKNLPDNGMAFSTYHKMDFVKKEAVYTSGIVVNEVPDLLPEEIISDHLPQTKAYIITHKGPYRHLGNPWTAGYMMARHKEFKLNNKTAPFEIYTNSPKDTAEQETTTQVCFPVK